MAEGGELAERGDGWVWIKCPSEEAATLEMQGSRWAKADDMEGRWCAVWEECEGRVVRGRVKGVPLTNVWNLYDPSGMDGPQEMAVPEMVQSLLELADWLAMRDWDHGRVDAEHLVWDGERVRLWGWRWVNRRLDRRDDSVACVRRMAAQIREWTG